MDDVLLQIFQNEVLSQCRAFLGSGNGLKAAFQRDDMDSIWLHIQGSLIAAANLTRLLWSSGGKRAERRLPLRISLDVTDDSPLRNTQVRNDFEHFDERVEEWYEADNYRGYLSRNIGPQDAFDIPDNPPERWFHHFDPQTSDVTFLGHVVNLAELTAEVRRIWLRAEAVLSFPEPQGGANDI